MRVVIRVLEGLSSSVGITSPRRGRKIKIWLVLAGLIIGLALVIWLGAGFWGAINTDAAETRAFSDEAFSYVLVRDEMGDYYTAHGRYPRLLRELTDSATPHRPEQAFKANAFEYEARVNTFVLRWKNPHLPRNPCLLEGRDGVIIRDDFSH